MDVNDDLHHVVGTRVMRYMAFEEDPGEQYSLADFDFDHDPMRLEFNLVDASSVSVSAICTV